MFPTPLSYLTTRWGQSPAAKPGDLLYAALADVPVRLSFDM